MLRFYNTLTKKKEEFTPEKDNTVRAYSCGPTVYSFAHIGNMRSYIFMDILRRALRHSGFKLLHVMNITDVGHLVSDADDGEDKMAKAAREQKTDPYAVAAMYTKAFFEDITALNIDKPEIIAKATEHIGEMIDFVTALCDKGYGYETSDGIYFDISKFPEYGRLSGANLEEQLSGARVEVNDEKRHPADFALWKKAPPEHIMQWQSPWGMGFPGWHIECSAMSRKYLGNVFDIHTGGVDHIPIHHENEIAQTEALTGTPGARVWMHGEFLLVDNGKMSKSLKNTYTVADLRERGFDPLAFRYLCLNGHYRNKLNFTWEAMRASQTALDRLYAAVLQQKNSEDKADSAVLAALCAEFDEAVADDLNIPRALAALWNAVRIPEKSRDIYDLAVYMDGVLGLGLADAKPKEEAAEPEVSPEIEELVQKRQAARKAKDFKAADAIRDELKSRGITLLDTPEGVRIVIRREDNA